MFWNYTKKYNKEMLNKTLLPKGSFSSSSGTIKDGKNAIQPINCEIPFNNRQLIDSKYYYEKKKKFIHYTKIENLLSILREKGVRMYNLNNSNDPQEFNFAAEVLKLENNQIDEGKKNIFSFSMSEINSEYEGENPILWRLYGNNGYGCAIIFEIVNNPKDWNYFHLSKIYYNEKDDIELFYEKSNEFQNKNPIRLKYDLSRLIAFHKDIIWKIENEIRLIVCFKNLLNLKPLSKNTFSDLNKKKKTSYNFLPLVYEKDDNIENLLAKTNPLLKISKIILGYNINNIEVINEVIDKLTEKIFNEEFDIKQSIFKGKIR